MKKVCRMLLAAVLATVLVASPLMVQVAEVSAQEFVGFAPFGYNIPPDNDTNKP